jgi:hypothetical protein
MPNTTNFNWATPADTDLVKDGAAAIRTLGNSIDSSFVDLKGGTTGQILSKASNTDLDFTFVTPNVGDITEVQAGTGISVASGTGPIPVVTNTVATEFDAKGDLVVGTGSDTFDRLAVGTNTYILTADSAETTGLKWVAPSSGALTLISNTSFDSTGYAIDSVFSSTYELYLIEWYAYQNNVVDQTASFRFRSSGGDITAGYYGSCFGYNTGATLSTISTSNGSAWTLPDGDAYTGSKFSMVFNRNSNHLSGTMITTTYNDNKRILTGGCVVAGTITGMKLQYGGSGSYGKLAIYGMAKA